ncbi:6-phosphogluconolactonase [Aurantimonas sp. A2-1-M11]|uniref:6-phosphogluconolactonase n=1 Tax=Aurantimonas sp. A2-1-M11 TaxID=3113712 RepID=UPI002F94099E
MSTAPVLHRYRDGDDLAEALAVGVAAVLAGAIATRGAATLAVSGGSTPRRFFERLSQAEIDWDHVQVMLVDERWVPASSDRSNAALVAESLLRNHAAAAHFLPFYVDAATPEAAHEDLAERFRQLARPLDVAVLGMGKDGHTASFFPDGDNLDAAIDPQTAEPVVAMRAPGAGEPRVTLTLPVLVEARLLAVHIEGDEKLAVYEKALTGGPVEELPIRAILAARREEPLNVFWCP